jgi:hypothetical protein
MISKVIRAVGKHGQPNQESSPGLARASAYP